MSATPKIGVFDSGFGGLTVLREMLRQVPAAEYLYFGDTARLPYGSKSAQTVAHCAIGAVRHLRQQGAEMMVIACNTATALAFPQIEAALDVPVIGVVEPGAETAAALTKSKNVAVIATEATVSSHAYQKALEKRGITAREKACPLLVPLIEEGWLDHSVTEQVAHIYMDEIFRDGLIGTDVLVLGCTHYPLIRSVLRKVVPPEVAIVDSAESTAGAVAKVLGHGSAEAGSHNPSGPTETKLTFFATDSTEKFQRLGERFLGRPIAHVQHVALD